MNSESPNTSQYVLAFSVKQDLLEWSMKKQIQRKANQSTRQQQYIQWPPWCGEQEKIYFFSAASVSHSCRSWRGYKFPLSVGFNPENVGGLCRLWARSLQFSKALSKEHFKSTRETVQCSCLITASIRSTQPKKRLLTIQMNSGTTTTQTCIL